MSLDKIIKINRQRVGLDNANDKLDQQFSLSSGAITKLVIYGRMRPGGPDEHHLIDLGGTWSDATFPGYIQSEDDCSIDFCPRLAWTPTGTWNEGFVFQADALKDHWSVLDAKEGADHARLLTPVQSSMGDYVANIYVSRDASIAQLHMLDGMNVHDDVDFRT